MNGRTRKMNILAIQNHPVEVSVTVWLKVLKEMCAQQNIHVLE